MGNGFSKGMAGMGITNDFVMKTLPHMGYTDLLFLTEPAGLTVVLLVCTTQSQLSRCALEKAGCSFLAASSSSVTPTTAVKY